MEGNVSCDVFKELLMILSYCANDFIKKIPADVLLKFSDLAADSLKDVYINKNKSLSEQDISDECKDLLSELYFRYVLDLKSKKELLNEIFTDGNDL